MLGKKRISADIRKKLKDPRLEARLEAIAELGRAGIKESIEELAKQLAHNSTEVKVAALKALGLHPCDEALAPILKALNDPEEKVAHSAAKVLAEFSYEEEIAEKLIQLLSRKTVGTYVKARAQKTLAGYGSKAFGKLLKCLGEDNPELKKRCVETLGMIAEPAAAEAIARQLESDDNGLVMVAVEALGNFGVMGLNPLIDLLGQSNVALKRRAVQSLAKIADPVSVPHLIPLLKDNDVYVRGYAARALGEAGDAAAVPALMKSLYQCNWDCSAAMVKIGEPAFKELTKGIYFDKTAVRTRAVKALLETGGERAIPYLIEALESESWGVRMTAVDALSHFRNDDVWAALVRSLKDVYWNVRKAAVEAIAGFERADVVDLLREMQKDGDVIVSRCASDALKQVINKHIG